MTHPNIVQDVQTARILDTLKITPEHFLHSEHHTGWDDTSRVDTIEAIHIQPSRTRWSFTALRRINLDTFHQRLQIVLDPLGVGYCYMMSRRGKIIHLRSYGFAQRPWDGRIGWDTQIPMNVGSVSKFVSAIALVRLLRDSNISLTSPIARFLPQYWTRHPNIDGVTFHALLRHEAGFAGDPNESGPGDFAAAKDAIESGIDTNWVGHFNYKNVNFAILRVLFATLTNTLKPSDTTSPFLLVSNDLFWDVISASAYSNYVNDYVFKPAGIGPCGFKADDNAAKAYGSPPYGPGEHLEDELAPGPGGWYLSIGELIQLMNRFRAGSMMPRYRAGLLLSNRYGLDPRLRTGAGTIYRKGGRTVNRLKAIGMDSAIYLMPGDVNFAIFVNSWDGTRNSYLDKIPELIDYSIESALFQTI